VNGPACWVPAAAGSNHDLAAAYGLVPGRHDGVPAVSDHADGGAHHHPEPRVDERNGAGSGNLVGRYIRSLGSGPEAATVGGLELSFVTRRV
jgi:hypothetical protein